MDLTSLAATVIPFLVLYLTVLVGPMTSQAARRLRILSSIVVASGTIFALLGMPFAGALPMGVLFAVWVSLDIDPGENRTIRQFWRDGLNFVIDLLRGETR